MYILRVYKTSAAKSPFLIWLNDLDDMTARVAIEMRIERIKIGNLGQAKALGGSLYELKIDTGPGYRVYFCKIGQQIIVLLCAGDKKSQQRDIAKARMYLDDYKNREQKDG